MSRRQREAWGPPWRALFAVVPAVLGALLLLTADPPAPGRARVVAQGSPTPLLASPTMDGAAARKATMEEPASSTTTEPAAALAALSPTAAAVPEAPAAGAVTGAVPAGTVPEAPTSTAAAAERAVEASPPSTTTSPTTTPPTTTPPTTAAIPKSPGRTPGAEAEVVPLTNGDRNAAGLGSLTRNPCLDAVASGYAEQLARSAVLAHNPGAGPAVIGCRPGATWGDNVGTAEPCSAALLEERWMASPGHRHNILTAAFTQIGVGAWTDDKGGCWVQVLFST